MAKSKPGKQTPSQTPMRVPAHGRGALRVGGTNKGGPGAIPSALREKLRGSFADRIATLEQFADGSMPLRGVCPECGFNEKATEAQPIEPSDRLKALDMLAKYGLGTVKEISVENVRERVQGTLEVIRRHASPEQATAIIAEMRPLWA